MGFKHKFERVPIAYGKNTSLLQWSLTITCTNWMMGETVNIGLFPSDGSQPWYFRDVHFKAGGSYRFDKQTVDWFWYQGDYAAILGPGDKIIQKFEFIRKEYGPGECPECHGTKKCKACGGRAYSFKPAPGSLYRTELTHCSHCNGGICPTCSIDYRKPNSFQGPTGLKQF